ncbi:MAG: hypothetical protein HYZ37_04440 [Candidatus Solibacter usitatus]|nr:hypothetical protein [Candidatus Solibacter usitatus]
MVVRKRRRLNVSGGFFRFEGLKTKAVMYGSGYGDFIRLRDEYGNTWRGEAEHQSDGIVRYRFRDETGNSISGMSDSSYGVILRDDKGNVWRGFLDS